MVNWVILVKVDSEPAGVVGVLKKIPEVLRIEPLFDEYDLLVEVAHKSHDELLAIAERIKRIDGVAVLRILDRTRGDY